MDLIFINEIFLTLFNFLVEHEYPNIEVNKKLYLIFFIFIKFLEYLIQFILPISGVLPLSGEEWNELITEVVGTIMLTAIIIAFGRKYFEPEDPDKPKKTEEEKRKEYEEQRRETFRNLFNFPSNSKKAVRKLH